MRGKSRVWSIVALAGALSLLAVGGPASARTLSPVCSATDVVDAVAAANSNPGPDTIELTAGCTYLFTTVDNWWYGPNALPAISSDLTIEGNGAVLERDASVPRLRFFFVGADPANAQTLDYTTPGAGALTLHDLTLRNGLAKGGDSAWGGGGAGMGGALFNQGSLTLERVTLSGNTARGGSGNAGAAGVGGGGIGADASDSSGGGFGGAVSAINTKAGGGSPTGGGGGGGGGFAGEDGNPSSGFPGGAGGGTATGLGGGGGADYSQGNSGGGGGDGSGGGGGNDNGFATGVGGGFGDGGQGGSGNRPSAGGGGGGVGGGGGADLTQSGSGGGGGGGFGGGGGGGQGGDGGFGGFGGGGGAGSCACLFGLAGPSPGGFGGGAGEGGDLTLVGGGGAGMGGAVFNQNGTLAIVNSTLSANTAQGGTGFENGSGLGGAVFNLNGTVSVTSSTLAQNTADEGTAVYNLGYDSATARTAALTVTNSILFDSTGSTTAPSHTVIFENAQTDTTAGTNAAFASLTFQEGNDAPTPAGTGAHASISGSPTTSDDPGLGPLQYNGGPGMETMAPDASGAAADAATNCPPPATDERGVTREDPCWLGAYEDNPANPAIHVEKDADVSQAHVGDTVTYTFTVTNAGNVPLSSVSVNDPKCDAAPSGPTGDTGNDAVLGTTETWTYTCTHQVTGGDGDPLHNVVTAEGTDGGAPVQDTDEADVDILHPDIHVVKDADVSEAHVGDTVTYTFTVTNIGDTPLSSVSVSDAKCDASTLTGPSGDTGNDGVLGTTETWTYTCTHQVTTADADPLHNEVTAEGSDSLGQSEQDTSSANVDVLHPGIQVEKDADVPEAHVGETVTYTFTVTNTGDTPLSSVSVTDPKCDAAPTGPTGDTGNDGALGTTETWTYTCTHLVTGSDPDPLHNVVTASGEDDLGGTAEDTDTADVDIVPAGPSCNGKSATIVGAPGNSTTKGTAGDDVIVDLSGNNKVNATQGGNDTVCTGDGADEVLTGGGNDWVDAGGGKNQVKSGGGDDTVKTGAGNDSINAGGGSDTVDAGDGTNKVNGAAGADNLTTGSGNDTISAGDGSDTVHAGDGKNKVTGAGGDDTLTSGAGNDVLDGGAGFDTCTPDGGTNTLKSCEA
jgi:hypothetical protein